MEIKIHRAFLVIGGKKERLTKAIARQFPILTLSASRRDGPIANVREPICKVRGSILDSVASWLYLVQDEEAGLVWEPACTCRGDYAEKMLERGYNVDNPSQVPTVIL